MGYRELGVVLGKDLSSIRSKHAKISAKITLEDDDLGKSGLPHSWRKIWRVLIEMNRNPRTEWIFWIDTDVLVIDGSFDPASLLRTDKDFLISSDAYGVCAGVFAARNSEWVRSYLASLLLLGPLDPVRYGEFDRKDSWEQNTIKATLRYFPAVRARFGIIPERFVQNRRSRFSSSAWLYHLWMEGRTAAEILEKHKLVRQKGWTRNTSLRLGQFHGLKWACMPGLATKLGVSLEELAGYFGRTGRLPPDTQELSGAETFQLIRYSNLLDTAVATFQQPGEIIPWLNRPSDQLGGATPLVCARTARGWQKATQLLRKIRPEPTLTDYLCGM